MFDDLSIDHITALLTIFSVIAALGGWVIKQVRALWQRTNKMLIEREVALKRINVLWGFHISRGYAEVFNRGLAVKDSSVLCDDFQKIDLHPRARAVLAEITSALQIWWGEAGNTLEPLAQIEAIEERWGPWLVEHVCIPLGISSGACLVMARQLASEAS